MDFTIPTYKKLLDALLKACYGFQTFAEFLESPQERVILLRHDVDAKKMNSLHFAEIQHGLGVKGSYYFRMVPQSYDPEVIRKIAEMGHEIGYHYEDMDKASSELRVLSSELKEEQLYDRAIRIFQENLEKLRTLYPIKTICMHGSPRSRFDNKALWKKYNYRDYGIIGEPYFDINFNEVFYLTDTGRRWDGEKVSIRDKVKGSGFSVQSSELNPEPKTQNPEPKTPSFHFTNQIIRAIEKNELPDKIMFTFHPQRWTNKPLPWIWELFFQNLKNQVKGYLVKRKSKVVYKED
jgi:hypothetical protein